MEVGATATLFRLTPLLHAVRDRQKLVSCKPPYIHWFCILALVIWLALRHLKYLSPQYMPEIQTMVAVSIATPEFYVRVQFLNSSHLFDKNFFEKIWDFFSSRDLRKQSCSETSGQCQGLRWWHTQIVHSQIALHCETHARKNWYRKFFSIRVLIPARLHRA